MVTHVTKFKVPGTDITLFGGPLLASAVKEFKELDVYQAGKVAQLIKTAYMQAKAEGAADVVADVLDTLKDSSQKRVRRGITPYKRGALRGRQLTIFGPRRN